MSVYNQIDCISFQNIYQFVSFQKKFYCYSEYLKYLLGESFYVSTQFRAYPFERALFSALNRVLLKN